MNLFEIMKMSSAQPAAPTSSAPPPSSVPGAPSPAPVIQVMGGRRAPAGRVAASNTNGNAPEHAANPLTAGPAQPYNGQMMTPEEIQQQQMQESQMQESAPKAESAKPIKQDTPLNDSILKGWDKRLSKLAEEDRDVRVYPGGSTRFDPSTPSGMVGVSQQIPSYNPFEAGSFYNKLYGTAKNFLTSSLRNVKPRSWVEDELAGPPNAYTMALARNLADPVTVAKTPNPLLVLGMNLARSAMGGLDPRLEGMTEELTNRFSR